MGWGRFNCSRSEAGFSLIEVLTSTAILATVSLGVAQMFIYASAQTRGGKVESSATILAEQKLEQLRSLTWGFDTEGLGLPVSDTTTNLAKFPPDQTGGGLNPSPANVMEQNTAGYVDFLDQHGAYLGTGTTPPDNTVYIRRWSIEPLPTNPNNTLVLQVFVTTKDQEQRRGAVSNKRWKLPGDAWLVSVKTRKSS
jgi:prepilin-type N-terminal cleavage/methylation domain-containing protein